MPQIEPPFRRIVTEVRRRIEAGELKPGDRVPSARAITREWGVAIATATKAHAALREEGLTVARPGVGTVVAGLAPRRDPQLTLERIVTAAIAIADREGIGELSMRRLATDLGVATMSLYRHVPGRDELEVAMIDAAMGELRLPARRPSWRRGLELAAREEWKLFKRHPWLAPLMSLTRPQLAPKGLLLIEWILGLFAGSPLDLKRRALVHVMMFSFVRGIASALEPEAAARQDSGLTSDEWMQRQEGFLPPMPPAPHFQQLVETDFDLDLDTLFEFGLARLLDGLEPLMR
jgi:DNA-binding transcriptional regulator YhcF (GntR family)